MVLSIITILITVSLELNRQVRNQVISAAVSRDRLTLRQMGASGIHMGIGMLMADKEKDQRARKMVDSVQEEWANPEKIGEVIDAFPFDEGKLELSIVDEIGKIQVNALVTYPEGKNFNPDQRALWDDILAYFIPESDSFDEVGTSGIVSAIKDWLDYGDDDRITGINGAESDYYRELDPPYACGNGPFTYLDELVLVKGITPEMFYSVGELMQLSRYITVYGMTEKEKRFTFEGKININTAELPVISALLPDGEEEFAARMIEYRTETADGDFINPLLDANWYKKVPDWNDDIKLSDKLITVTSDFFHIECKASKNDLSVTTEAVIERKLKDNSNHKWTYRILSWKVL